MDASERDATFNEMLEKAVNPAVEMCERMAELIGGSGNGNSGAWGKDIFLINCLGFLEVSIPIFSAVSMYRSLIDYTAHTGSLSLYKVSIRIAPSPDWETCRVHDIRACTFSCILAHVASLIVSMVVCWNRVDSHLL